MPSNWTFRQLAGLKSELVLSDWSKPFGRPRKGAVVELERELRKEETYYPGDNSGPTVHVFGSKFRPWEIHGYLRDASLGRGGALRKRAEIESFFEEKQRCRVVCEDLELDHEGMIELFRAGLEGKTEIEWSMTIAIYKENRRAPTVRPRIPLPPTTHVVRLRNALLEGMATLEKPRQNPLEAFVAGVNNLLFKASNEYDRAKGILLTVTGGVLDKANAIRSFETATFAEIATLRGALNQIPLAARTLRETLAQYERDTDLQRADARGELDLGVGHASLDDAIREVMAGAAELDRDAELAAVLRAKATHTAREGDTWESLAVLYYGSPDRAQVIRDANSGSGTYPIAGTIYLIPE